MNDFNRLSQMIVEDKLLYKTICEIVDEVTPTEKIYEIWCELHSRKSWKVSDIEHLFRGEA